MGCNAGPYRGGDGAAGRDRRPIRHHPIRVRATLLGQDSYDDVEWETGGLAARAWFHEIDHLDGRLISDHGIRTRMDRPRHLV